LLTVSGFVVGAAGFYQGPRMTVCRFGPATPEGVAAVTVRKLAYEAFPSWQLARPDRRCPEQLDDLLAWMNEKELMDPWGRDYRFRCTGAEKPTLVVWSAGPDRRHGTTDDIRSDS
jgi:hypothetical protein